MLVLNDAALPSAFIEAVTTILLVLVAVLTLALVRLLTTELATLLTTELVLLAVVVGAALTAESVVAVDVAEIVCASVLV